MGKRNSKGRDSHSFPTQLKQSQLMLSLVVASLVIYAFFHVPREEQDFFGMVVKCLPIVLLQAFVYRHGLSSTDNYGHKLLAGLIFSSIGDAFLDFPGYFLHGTIAFGIAQFCYITAFGFSPLKIPIAIGVFGLFSLPLLLVLENLLKLQGISSVVLPSYALVLKTMVWRSISRATVKTDGKLDCAKVVGGLGGFIFAISDTSIALNKFWRPFPYSHMITMTTYYMAQVLIALSVFHKRPNTKSS